MLERGLWLEYWTENGLGMMGRVEDDGWMTHEFRRLPVWRCIVVDLGACTREYQSPCTRYHFLLGPGANVKSTAPVVVKALPSGFQTAHASHPAISFGVYLTDYQTKGRRSLDIEAPLVLAGVKSQMVYLALRWSRCPYLKVEKEPEHNVSMNMNFAGCSSFGPCVIRSTLFLASNATSLNASRASRFKGVRYTKLAG